MSATALSFADVSDYLGPAEQRFFGAGYRRATYDIGPLRAAEGDRGIDTTVTVAYPRDWSRKQSSTDLRPHLSTVDVLVLGARFADHLLATAVGLTPDRRSAARVVRATIKAGTSPQESLAEIPVAARIAPWAGGTGLAGSLVTVTIGQMSVDVAVSHSDPADPADSAAASHPAPPQDPGYWGDGFRADSQTITDVVADPAADTCDAELSVRHGERPGPTGLEDAHPPTVSLVDAFVTHVQLAQVLIYEMDGLSRSESNTLWMQQTVLERDPASVPAPTGPTVPTVPTVPVHVAITRADVLKLGKSRWRDVAFTGTTAGITQRSVFAHRLPDPVPS